MKRFFISMVILILGSSQVSAENPIKPLLSQVVPAQAQQAREVQPSGSSGQALVPDNDPDDSLFDEFEEASGQGGMVADPLYYFNYAMFSLNDWLYFYALKPVAQGYKAITPVVVRNGIKNFFHNLLFPVRFVNNLLQGKAESAVNEVGIFIVNSTLGIAGFNDFAQQHMDIQTSDEDLGQTLGAWTIGDGFYLVLPVFGPSTLRDAVGSAGDLWLTPITYVDPWELKWGLWGLDRVNDTSMRIGDYEALKEASIDPYAALRNAYIQNRRSEIKK